ncbi:FUN14 superfamily-containing protein [Candidatus Nitrososphaera gargensis Ga9.2]|uniref:FUN14 superfamily-containing protein n=1 Tax=Nitrososphaera gargensis (strain Ga9.2) TaxID=1237085 RepID=K0IHA2_NITGG|nr:FUN14 domain-containing protein [Candidatus Nitrososphaera gargensis]AFU58253.1 FUN14 superfamily-containing protein [Candidatus Nitrososphaera gargensis Ga9.2]
MSVDLAFTGTSVGFGGIAGFLIGYAIKKAIKIMMIIVGLFFAALAYLNYQGIVTINWDKLSASASGVTSGLGNATGQIAGVSDQIAPTLINFGIPLTGSFAAAFVLGFMKG